MIYIKRKIFYTLLQFSFIFLGFSTYTVYASEENYSDFYSILAKKIPYSLKLMTVLNQTSYLPEFPLKIKKDPLITLSNISSTSSKFINTENTNSDVSSKNFSELNEDLNNLLDERALRLDNYFEKYNMPLRGYGEKFIQVADECKMDWRLLPAISVQESTGGKYMRLNNPFGWGSAKIGFKDFEEAIEIVGKNLCGLNEKTAHYYRNKNTYQKLWSYNGSVNHSYPSRVMAIMEKF